VKADVGLVGPLNIDLLIAGEAPTDLYELTRWSGPSQVTMCAAGSGGYIAQDLARFGLKTSLVSTLADDPFGDVILQILKKAGLNTDYVDRQPNTLSGIGIYMLLFGSKKRPLTYRLPTHLPWPKPFTREQEEFLLENHRHIHSAGYLHFPDMWTDEMAGLFQKAKAKGLSTSLDPQFVLFPVTTPWLAPLKELLKFVDLLFVDEDEARKITLETNLKGALETFKNLGPKMIVIKRGDQGSIVYANQSIYDLPAVQVPEKEIVDSIGAGDAFDTGMIYGFLNNWSIDRCQKFATLAAASTLGAVGGTTSLAGVGELTKESLK
jgi:2-dehydro-3-deoxygluconokinase